MICSEYDDQKCNQCGECIAEYCNICGAESRFLKRFDTWDGIIFACPECREEIKQESITIKNN